MQRIREYAVAFLLLAGALTTAFGLAAIVGNFVHSDAARGLWIDKGACTNPVGGLRHA